MNKNKLIILLLISLLFACNKDDSIGESLVKLPKLSITIKNLENVSSKTEYLEGRVELMSRAEGEDLSTSLKIKGRGNSSWTFPKKSYQIKFDSKENMLGMPADKKWILLANYADKTMLRNELAFDLGRLSDFLDWTPKSRFVELRINGEYLGIYQLTQKIEESSNRVDIGDNGFLLEVDQLDRLDPEDVYFETSNHLFHIKEPDVEFEGNKFTSIRDYIQLTEEVLLGDNFLDPIEGYAKYIDIESFVDWYLINEMTKNNDANFGSSVYMNYTPGGQLKMGPIWDFDISLGNINYNGNETIEGFWIKEAPWIARLFDDPIFINQVKMRFNYFYENQDIIIEKLHSNVATLESGIQNNFYKWPILGVYVWPNNVYYPTYEGEIVYLEEWFSRRLEWLKDAIEDL